MNLNSAVQVKRIIEGKGSASEVNRYLSGWGITGRRLVIVDHFFANDLYKPELILESDWVEVFDSDTELNVQDVDEIVSRYQSKTVSAVIGFGGGGTLDCAKAVSNMLANPGSARDYQGWDLVRSPGVFKVGIPTIHGTGAEATRTCVMLNSDTGIKLGMNSDHSVFDAIFMDYSLSKTVPDIQFFYTGMDTYIHCFESMEGRFRSPIADRYSQVALDLCRDIFLHGSMQSDKNREKLAVASYLGGSSIGMTMVGLVHPLSAALSVVFGIHHCEANCRVMYAMERYYPKYFNEFWAFAEANKVVIPKDIKNRLTDDVFDKLYASTMVHKKPLMNALGGEYRDELTPELVNELFSLM